MDDEEEEDQEIVIWKDNDPKKFIDIVVATAGLCGQGSLPNSRRLPQGDLDLNFLDEPRRRRRICTSPVLRQAISLTICQVRKQVKKKKVENMAMHFAKTGRVPLKWKRVHEVYHLKDYENQDIIYTDIEDIMNNVERYYSMLYEGEEDCIPTWVL